MVAASKLVAPDAFAKFASFYSRNRPAIQRGMTGVLGLYITWACLGGLAGNSKASSSKASSRRRSSKGKGVESDSSKPVRVQVDLFAFVARYRPGVSSAAEMVTWIPISSPFVRFADKFIDEALGFAAGYNFFIFQAIQVPFEVTAIHIILEFWTNKIPTWAIITIALSLYLYV